MHQTNTAFSQHCTEVKCTHLFVRQTTTIYIVIEQWKINVLNSNYRAEFHHVQKHTFREHNNDDDWNYHESYLPQPYSIQFRIANATCVSSNYFSERLLFVRRAWALILACVSLTQISLLHRGRIFRSLLGRRVFQEWTLAHARGWNCGGGSFTSRERNDCHTARSVAVCELLIIFTIILIRIIFLATRGSLSHTFVYFAISYYSISIIRLYTYRFESFVCSTMADYRQNQTISAEDAVRWEFMRRFLVVDDRQLQHYRFAYTSM